MTGSCFASMRVFAQDLQLPDSPQDLLDRRSAMMLELFKKPIAPMPGLLDLLRAFHGRLKLAVATSAPRAFTDLILPSMGLQKFFDAVQTSDDVTQGKPHPEIYLKAIARLPLQDVSHLRSSLIASIHQFGITINTRSG